MPPAGLGALLALQVTNTPLSVVAFIGIILLIGIVKKNGIMMVDFAIEAERRGLDPAQAVLEACMVRFRPILMTSLGRALRRAAADYCDGPGLGAAPAARHHNCRRTDRAPQILTLYTTPVIYLLIDRLRRREKPAAITQPAE